jgi:hypothetical protein
VRKITDFSADAETQVNNVFLRDNSVLNDAGGPGAITTAQKVLACSQFFILLEIAANIYVTIEKNGDGILVQHSTDRRSVKDKVRRLLRLQLVNESPVQFSHWLCLKHAGLYIAQMSTDNYQFFGGNCQEFANNLLHKFREANSPY